jgi:hypothetical protein
LQGRDLLRPDRGGIVVDARISACLRPGWNQQRYRQRRAR